MKKEKYDWEDAACDFVLEYTLTMILFIAVLLLGTFLIHYFV